MEFMAIVYNVARQTGRDVKGLTKEEEKARLALTTRMRVRGEIPTKRCQEHTTKKGSRDTAIMTRERAMTTMTRVS